MIESHLDPQTDGLSFAGKAHELTVAEIAEQSHYPAGEGRLRSVSAVLRIVDERSAERGEFVSKPLTEDRRKTFAKLRSVDPEGWLRGSKELAREVAE